MIYLTDNGEIYDHMINHGNIKDIRGISTHNINPLVQARKEQEIIVIVKDQPVSEELTNTNVFTTIVDVEITGSLPKLKHGDLLILKTSDSFVYLNI